MEGQSPIRAVEPMEEEEEGINTGIQKETLLSINLYEN
jgi:hypothetical protein